MDRVFVCACAILLIITSVASAQPAANANIWDGTKHQPTEGRTQQKEEAAGVAPTEAKKSIDENTLTDVQRHLPAAPPASPAPAPVH